MKKLEKLLSESEVLEILSISKASILRAREKNEITFYRIGKSVRYKMSDVERFLDERKVQKEA